MSFVTVELDALGTAVTDLGGLNSSIRGATAAAAAPTTGIVAAAGDEISAAIAKLFGGYGQGFQAVSAQAASFHDRFLQAFQAGVDAYARTEVAGTSTLQALKNDVMGLINTPTELAASRPLFGDGANGAAGTGENGGDGGYLGGNGGNGGSGVPGTAGANGGNGGNGGNAGLFYGNGGKGGDGGTAAPAAAKYTAGTVATAGTQGCFLAPVGPAGGAGQRDRRPT